MTPAEVEALAAFQVEFRAVLGRLETKIDETFARLDARITAEEQRRGL